MSDRPLPSDAELRILRELWIRGDRTVRELHERLSADWPVGYTTVLKLLQRMHDKGLVERDEEGRAHRWRAVVSEERTERRLVRDLADRAFGGSVARMLERVLPESRADGEELEEIRRLLEEAEP